MQRAPSPISNSITFRSTVRGTIPRTRRQPHVVRTQRQADDESGIRRYSIVHKLEGGKKGQKEREKKRTRKKISNVLGKIHILAPRPHCDGMVFRQSKYCVRRETRAMGSESRARSTLRRVTDTAHATSRRLNPQNERGWTTGPYSASTMQVRAPEHLPRVGKYLVMYPYYANTWKVTCTDQQRRRHGLLCCGPKGERAHLFITSPSSPDQSSRHHRPSRLTGRYQKRLGAGKRGGGRDERETLRLRHPDSNNLVSRPTAKHGAPRRRTDGPPPENQKASY